MRQEFLNHPFGARRVKMSMENKGVRVSTTHLRDLRASNDPPIKVDCASCVLLRVLCVCVCVQALAGMKAMIC